MNILIITDAWHPQVNGVVTTLTTLTDKLKERGHIVRVITHQMASFRLPTPYKDVSFAHVKKSIYVDSIEWADAIHVATPEGPVGRRGVKYCKKLKRPFTTGYHSKWPEFINSMFPFVKERWVRSYMKRVHKGSSRILVPTKTVKTELEGEGYQNVEVWTRGTDKEMYRFFPEKGEYLLCVSRVSKEKNLEDFFKLPGIKVMVGDGPMLETYKDQYPQVEFVGEKRGQELVEYYGKAKCFVFPSKNDTFGLVMIEAMSCGTPVAAYNVTGPIDVIGQGVTGFYSDNLKYSVDRASRLNREKVFKGSKVWDWENTVDQFLEFIVEIK
jgi:glycosyltransferase involved in cell wall biosynthesis